MNISAQYDFGINSIRLLFCTARNKINIEYNKGFACYMAQNTKVQLDVYMCNYQGITEIISLLVGAAFLG